MAAIETLTDAEPGTLARFDTIIDVRAPCEFAQDHAPGAINLPVLSDAERAEVGTIYAQRSKFEARRLGAAYVARNIADHLQGALADRPGGFHPLLYCWRGGMRSNAMALVLAEVGWRVGLLKGGYKTYRARVRRRLYDEALHLSFVRLDGPTGTGKTEILEHAGEHGLQAVDLEGLAAHRGSLLGAMPGRPQPGQKLFESRLLQALEALDPARPVLVEAELSKVGEVSLPPALWSAMGAGPRITLSAPATERVRYLVSAYADAIADRAWLDEALSHLPPRIGRKRIAAWRELAATGGFEALAEALLEHHYDPAYARSNRAAGEAPIATLALQRLDPASLSEAGSAIARAVTNLSPAKPLAPTE